MERKVYPLPQSRWNDAVELVNLMAYHYGRVARGIFRAYTQRSAA